MFLAATAFLVFAASSASASSNWTSDTLHIKQNGNYYAVTFNVAVGQMIEYFNGEDCGNASHKTSGGFPSRFFGHIHIAYTLPKTGVDQFGSARTINNAGEIDGWWTDKQYPVANYTLQQGADHKYNCYCFALGYDNTWIQDPSWIYADDYKVTSSFYAMSKDCLDGHVISIRDVFQCGKIKETWEKFCESGLYKRTYASPGSDPRGTVRIYKTWN